MDSFSAEKAESFLGIVRVDLDHLSFRNALEPGETHRKESAKGVARMLGIFRLEGCIREHDRNFIEGDITDERLDDALAEVGISKQALVDRSRVPLRRIDSVPYLHLRHPIECNDGLHRISAAKEFLDNNDRWWIVKLFRKGGYPSLSRIRVHESYANEQSYTDGTIFRNIRSYFKKGNKVEENKWWARLSEGKKKDLRYLISSDKYSDWSEEVESSTKYTLIELFDQLLDLGGLWPPIQLGTLHRLHGLRCREELFSYLLHVKAVWTSMVPRSHWIHVDEVTVSELELLAPAISSHDHGCVERLMQTRRIFTTVVDEEVRAELLQGILSQTHLIPSLRTFFEDQKYLEPCSTILKSLLDDSEKRPLWRAFKANYWPTNKIHIQYSESEYSFKELQTSQEQDKSLGMKLGYLQLWLFCIRHFPELTTIKPRIGSRKRRKLPIEYSLARFQQLGCLAVRLGFRTRKALDMVLEASSWTEQTSKRMQRPISLLTNSPAFTDGHHCPRDRRSGRPYEDDHEEDQVSLFPFIFYSAIKPGENVTPLFVKRNILEAFMGPFIAPIQQDMAALLDLLITEQTAHPMEPTPQDFIPLHKIELERLRRELAESLKKSASSEAQALKQFSLFQTELASKISRISELEQRLKALDNFEPPNVQFNNDDKTHRINELETQNRLLMQDNSLQKEQMIRIENEKQAATKMNDSLQQKLNACEEERAELLMQIDDSDVLGEDYDNSNLGAPPNEEQERLLELRIAVDEKEALVETLRQELKAKDDIYSILQGEMNTTCTALSSLQRSVELTNATIGDLRAAIEDKDATLNTLLADAKTKDIDLKTLQTRTDKAVGRCFEFGSIRHRTLLYDTFHKEDSVRELDLNKIFPQIDLEKQWQLDVATIMDNFIESPGCIHITLLKVDEGVRSAFVNVPIEGLYTVKRVLDRLRRKERDHQRDHGLFLTLPDITTSSLISLVLTHLPDDAKDFVQVCQQKDARVFFGLYDDFASFFDRYKMVYTQRRTSTSGKRAGGVLENSGKRFVSRISEETTFLTEGTSVGALQ